MKNILTRIMKALGFVPAPPKPKVQPVQTKKSAPLTTYSVNEQVRTTLTMARDFYAKRGDRIVSTDIECYLGSFEEILLMSATDGSSIETAKLFGQVSSQR
jgi:hypothetical protein